MPPFFLYMEDGIGGDGVYLSMNGWDVKSNSASAEVIQLQKTAAPEIQKHSCLFGIILSYLSLFASSSSVSQSAQ